MTNMDKVGTIIDHFCFFCSTMNCPDCIVAGIIHNCEEEEKRGRWIKSYIDELKLIAVYTCSICGTQELSEFHYCPNCGAKMKGW